MVGDMSILCSIILSASPIVYNWNLVFHLSFTFLRIFPDFTVI